MASYLKWDDRQVLMMHCHWDKFHRIINDMKLASEHASGNGELLKKFRLNGGFEMNGGSKLYSHVCHAYWP